jgi:FixH
MNWGNKLLVTFVVFGAGMIFLVYRAVKTNYELVEKDYYKNELSYQQVIDGVNRVNALSTSVKIQSVAEGILLQLPEEMKNKTISGTIWFYCAYDEKKDKKADLDLSADASEVFSKELLQPGTYTVKLNWVADEKAYYAENSLTVQ